MSRRKTVVIAVLAICIILLFTVSGTLAYPIDRTAPLENIFVFSADGLKATLTEPGWNPNNAKNIVPGSIITKNPQINNTGTVDEWTAIKVTFCYGPDAGASKGKPLSPADLAKVLAAVTINWNTVNWIRFDDSTAGDTSTATALSQTFYCNSKIRAADPLAIPAVPAGSTIPLFTTVTIKSTNTETQMADLKTMGGFRIFVEGCAVQSDVAASMTPSAANTAFTFANTPV